MSEDELDGLNERAGSHQAVTSLLGLLVEAVKDICEAEAASLLLYDPEQDNLYFDVAIGGADERLKRIRLERGQGIAGFVLHSAEPLLVPDVAVDTRFSPEADESTGFRTRSIVAVPLWDDQDGPVGVVEAVNRKLGIIFDEDDLAHLVALREPLAASVAAAQRVRRGVPEAITEFYHGMARIMNVRANVLQQGNQRLSSARHRFETEQARVFVEEKLAGLSRLTAGIAHEINNPLGFVSSNLNSLNEALADALELLMKIDDLRQSQPEALLDQLKQLFEESDIFAVLDDSVHAVGECVTGVERVARISTQLQRFADVDRENFGEIDLNVEIERVLSCMQPEPDKPVTMNFEPGQLPPVRAMRRLISEVFLELLQNAVRAVEANGRITVLTSVEKDEAVVVVADNGCGMSPTEQAHIFDPFYTNKSKTWRATGLGLSAAYGIVVAHGGKLEVDSRQGAGSRFTVKIPLRGPIEAEGATSGSKRSTLRYYEAG